MQALVTDAHLRTAVAAIRGMGRAGIPVVAMGPSAAAAGLRSRYAVQREVAPDPARDAGGFRAALARLARDQGPLVVYSCQESSLDSVLEMAAQTDDLRLPHAASVSALARLRDKRALRAEALAVGLIAPEQHYEGPAGALADVDLPFPCIVKPLAAGGALERPRHLSGRADVSEVVTALPPGEQVLVQERATGGLTAVVLLLDRDGVVRARFQQEAIRTWPPGAGPSALAVSVAPDEEMAGRCRDLLVRAGYWGLAELQFVGTARGPALIDVNTRFYGSLPLALRAGVHFPALLHRCASGEAAPAEPPTYSTGVGFRWLEADLSAAATGRLGVLLRSGPRPRAGAMWARDDPVAAALLAREALAVRVRRRVGTRR
jgi:predicted ATP-grasp superfamily ATP-dependent carboligase